MADTSTTLAPTDQSHAEFEAWHIAEARKAVPALKDWTDSEILEGTASQRKNGSYSVGGAQTAWEAWQASRRAPTPASSEPVAVPAGMEPVARASKGQAAFFVKWTESGKSLRGTGIDLYTAAQVQAMLAQGIAPGWKAQPMERKPLSLAKIRQIDAHSGLDAVDFARAIEAAHGITG